MKIRDTNWMMIEQYLKTDDRCVVRIGCTKQHAYFSLAVDAILAENVAADAAELRNYLGDDNFVGEYQKPDEVMDQLWQVAVKETRGLIESEWGKTDNMVNVIPSE